MNTAEQIKQLTERIDKLEQEVLLLKTANSNKITFANTGKKWTDDEDKQLIDELKQRKTFDEIGELHKRNKGGIQSRVDNHIRDFYRDGHGIAKIAKALCLEETYIKNVLQVKPEDKKPKAQAVNYFFDKN